MAFSLFPASLAAADCTLADADTLGHLRRLLAARWAVLASMALLIWVAAQPLAIPLPLWPLSGVLVVAAAFNALRHWRLRQASTASQWELLSQLLLDIAILSALVFLSGGATNPLVSLLLPPVAIAALTLPASCVALVAAVAIAAYSALMAFYLPLPLPDASRAAQLHLTGMWLTFAVSTAMIAWFVVRMTRLIRARDAELAAAREQGLRNERVMAMGTLAAGAAHELGTPLATMSLLAGELAGDPRLPSEIRDDIDLLRQQIGVCKQIITGLSRRAGAERLENVQRIGADQWLEQLRQHWHAARPQSNSRLLCRGMGQPPELLADPRLEQALLNLLNNAASASQGTVDLELDWDVSQLYLRVVDHGPGFPPAVLARGGRQAFPAHAGGSGIGLLLTHSAIAQLGGQLLLDNPGGGGARASIQLPRLGTPSSPVRAHA
ncbi:ATP-binding protein [Dechloromonas sp. ZY10]|uniref:ATP-binding protein n=1 Tax=Dechloromonas aquae TaxID=2664436 RepID=UPI00352804D6